MTDEQMKEMHERQIIDAINDSILGLAKAVKDTLHMDVPVAILNPAGSSSLKPSNVLATLMMFYNTAYLLPQSKVINEISPQFKALFSENYTEKQQQILTTYAQYGLLREFLTHCNYSNFSFTDLFAPSFHRYKTQLHSISNFLWFRETATEHLYTVLTEYKTAYTQCKPVLESTSALKIGISNLTDEIVRLRESIAQLPTRVDPLFQKYNRALENQQLLNRENNEFTNQMVSLTTEVAELENQVKKRTDEYRHEESTLITKQQNDSLMRDIEAAEKLSADLRAQHDALVSSINVLEQYNNSLLDITSKITELIYISDQYSDDSDKLQAQLENLEGTRETINSLNVQIDTSKREIETMNAAMQNETNMEQIQDNPSLIKDKEKCQKLSAECESLEAIYLQKVTQLKALRDELDEENAKIAKIKEDSAIKIDNLSDKANEMTSAFLAQITGMIEKLNSM